MIQTNRWKAGESQQGSGQCGPSEPQPGPPATPKKEWPVRRSDRTSDCVVIPQSKKRGRPPLIRSVNVDLLKKEPTETGRDDVTGRSAKIRKTLRGPMEGPAIPGKRKRGRPPLNRTLTVKPKVEDAGRAVGVKEENKKPIEKRRSGRPFGSLNKKTQNKSSASFQSFLGPKRGPGRPRKTELLYLNKTSNAPNISALTKQITVRLTKMNDDAVTLAGKKKPLKVENNAVVEEKTKDKRQRFRDVMTVKRLVQANKKSLERSNIKTKDAVVKLTDIMKGEKRADSSKAASVTVVLKKQRGRPKKHNAGIKPNQQVFRRVNTLPGSLKSEEAGHLPGGFNYPKYENPAVSTEVVQIPQETISPVMVQQGTWEAPGVSEDMPAAQYAQWENRPPHTVWTLDDGAESLDSSSVTQFVVGESMAPQTSQPQCCKGPEHTNYQDDFLQGLSDLRSQLSRELAATRREVREGVELVRSAIVGVSTEIHRLGLILQPLVNVLAAGNLLGRSPNYGAAFHPPQETPPDDTMDIPQASTPHKNSHPSLNEGPSLDHLTPRNTPTESSSESLPEIISSVKMEDLADNLHSCTYRSQAILSMEAEKPCPQSLFISHHNLPQPCSSDNITASATSDLCANTPPPLTHHIDSHDSHLEDCDCTQCDEDVTTDDSPGLLPEVSSSGNHDDLIDTSCQRDSPSIISEVNYIDNESPVGSVASSHKDQYPVMPTDHQTPDLPPHSFEEHTENDTNPVLHPYISPAPSPGNLQEDMDHVVDLPSLESNAYLCQAQEPSMINLRTSPVTVPDSSMGSSAEASQGEAGNLEGMFLEETLCKAPQEYSESFINSVVPSQTPPTSPQAHTPLL